MSLHPSAASLRFEAIDESGLDWLCALEADLHAFPWTRGNFADSLDAGYGLWRIVAGDEALGYAVVLQVLDEAHLLNMGVARSAQGKGYGLALLDWLAATVRARGASQFFLEVRPSNAAALRLYDKAGFSQVARRRGYYPAAGGREDAIVMRKAL